MLHFQAGLHVGPATRRSRPSNDFQVITLTPELFISGRVTDASTGRPIESFRIRQGLVFANARSRIFWQRPRPGVPERPLPFQDERPYFGVALQAIAKGYKPARSRTFQATEGSQTYDFALKPGKGPTGVVVRPDGTPISGVDVALATKTVGSSSRKAASTASRTTQR